MRVQGAAISHNHKGKSRLYIHSNSEKEHTAATDQARSQALDNDSREGRCLDAEEQPVLACCTVQPVKKQPARPFGAGAAGAAGWLTAG